MKFFRRSILAVFSTGFIFWAISQKLFPQVLSVTDTITSYLVLGAVFVLVNTFLKPILKIVSFPLTIITLGVFRLAINGILLYVVKGLSKFGSGGVVMEIHGGVFNYLLLGLVFGLFYSFFLWLEK